jgi:hypothetical protein
LSLSNIRFKYILKNCHDITEILLKVALNTITQYIKDKQTRDLQLHLQSVPIATDVMSSNLDQGEVCNIMWYNLSVTCDRSVVFSGSSGFLHQYNWPPRYNWNIVESGIKHKQTNKATVLSVVETETSGENHRSITSN